MRGWWSKIASGWKVGVARFRTQVVRYLLMLSLALCCANAASAGAPVYQIELPPLTVAEALTRLSEQTGVQVLFPYELVRDKPANPVSGRCTLIEALQILLRGTGLSGGLSEKGVLTISIVGSEASTNGETTMIPNEDQQGSSRTASLSAGAPSAWRRFAAAVGALIASAGVAGKASAQEVAQSSGQLEEVIVTAQKREQALLEVPISVSAFTGATLEKIGANQLADFLQTAPGVSLVDSQDGFQSINIRGIASTYGDSPVGYYLDEVSFSLIGNTVLPSLRTYDLDRVEVLRGPQGTLYGDGSLGGVIRVLTRNPNLSEFEANADLTGSQTEHSDGENWAAKAMVNVPLVTDKVALRVVATKEDYDGWVDNTLTGQDDFNDREFTTYRAKLRIAPIENLDVVLAAWHHEEEGLSGTSLPDRTSNLVSNDDRFEYDIYSLTANYDFGPVSLLSATSIMDWSQFTVGELAGFPTNIDQSQDLVQQEFRLTSSGEGFRWTAGAYYREIERDTRALYFGQNFIQFSDSKAWAVFGEMTWPLFDNKLEATLGLRYFEDERSRRDEPDLIGQVESKFDNVSPRVNIAWHPSDDWMIYGNVGKGFRSGQIQPVVSIIVARSYGIDVPVGIDADEAWSYEVGIKGTALDKRLQLEAAVYYNDWSKLLLNQSLGPDGQISALLNGGTAGVLGVELNAIFIVMPGLSLQAGASVNDAEYKEAVPGAGINEGDRIAGVPKTTWNAAVTYERPMTASLTAFARAGVQYTSERFGIGLTSTPSDDLTTVDARLGLEGEHWGAFLFGDNLTDENGALTAIGLGALGQANRYRPRTVGLNLRISF